jgi:hypothetical protein
MPSNFENGRLSAPSDFCLMMLVQHGLQLSACVVLLLQAQLRHRLLVVHVTSAYFLQHCHSGFLAQRFMFFIAEVRCSSPQLFRVSGSYNLRDSLCRERKDM